MVRPRASLVAPLGQAAITAYLEAGWQVTEHGHLTAKAGADMGPCASCRQHTVRYGEHGQPLCPDCRKEPAC